MLNLLPWRRARLQKDTIKYLIILTMLIICTNILTFYIKHLFLKKCDDLQNETFTVCKKIQQQVHARKQLRSQLLVIARQQCWQKARQRQKAFLGFLERFPDFLPANSYLSQLILTRNEVILEGTLLSSSQQALQTFIDTIGHKYGLVAKQRSVELLSASEQKFYLVFTNRKE